MRDNKTYQDCYCIGIEIVYPKEGAKYWKLPSERLITIDMGPDGESNEAFTACNRKENPFSGFFKFMAYIRSVGSGETLAIT